MASYGYEAIEKSGKERKGSIESGSIEKAKTDLKNQGMTIISLTEQNILTKDVQLDFGGKPTSRDLSVFCRQFVSMTKAGVSILEALKMLCEQTENTKLQRALQGVRVSVEKGETLSGSMAEYPKIFPHIMINMVAAGEASGSLEVALDRVATQLERNSKTQGLIKKAMIYPIVVGCVAVAVVIVMLLFVIPAYTDIFDDLGTELPGITKAVVAASDFVQAKWYLLLLAAAGIAALIRYYAGTDSGKHVFGKIALIVPVVKRLVVKSASSQMARTLSTLLEAGVPMVEALEIVSNVMGNIWFKEALVDIKEQVVLGVPLSQPMEASGLFPPMVYHMVRIGEESGNTEEMLNKLADYYEEEVELEVQSLMAVMEPLIILVLAVIVFVLIAAVMAPMMNMYSALDNL